MPTRTKTFLRGTHSKGELLGPGKGVGVEIGIVKADLPVAREAAPKVKGWSVTEIRRQEWDRPISGPRRPMATTFRVHRPIR